MWGGVVAVGRSLDGLSVFTCVGCRLMRRNNNKTPRPSDTLLPSLLFSLPPPLSLAPSHLPISINIISCPIEWRGLHSCSEHHLYGPVSSRLFSVRGSMSWSREPFLSVAVKWSFPLQLPLFPRMFFVTKSIHYSHSYQSFSTSSFTTFSTSISSLSPSLSLSTS